MARSREWREVAKRRKSRTASDRETRQCPTERRRWRAPDGARDAIGTVSRIQVANYSSNSCRATSSRHSGHDRLPRPKPGTGRRDRLRKLPRLPNVEQRRMRPIDHRYDVRDGSLRGIEDVENTVCRCTAPREPSRPPSPPFAVCLLPCCFSRPLRTSRPLRSSGFRARRHSATFGIWRSSGFRAPLGPAPFGSCAV